MITHTKLIEEFHSNGHLAYICTFAFINSLWDNMYPNRIQPDDGSQALIRVGKSAKYWDNGQLHWELNHDENGNLIKEKTIWYNRDGAVIGER